MRNHHNRRVRSQDTHYIDPEEQFNQVQQPFNINTFKTEKCNLDHNSSQRKVCADYHDLQDKRRNPETYQYRQIFFKIILFFFKLISCQLCPQDCQINGCSYAHNKVEQLYHPNRYKTKLCNSVKNCQYGKYCSFAHGQNELRLPYILDKLTHDQEFYMFLYKTVWCPQIEGHDRGNCVYAHNAQDFRRDPLKLVPTECQYWNKDLPIQRFEQGGCKDFENCQYCHGWKELEYHPHVYKTKPCTSQNCQKKQQECAFYHSDQDKRIKRILQDGTVQMQDCKKQLGKQNGPIVATYRPQKEQNISKIHQGAPFDIFSQSKTKGTESRKMSDISYEAMDKNKPKFQQQNQYKKTRTAPTTPDKRGQQQKQKIMLEFGFSKRFASIISKQQQGQQILQTLQGLKIQEFVLIQMSDQQLNSLHLSGSQKNILINAISDIKAEKKFEEDSATQLLEETLEQQQF